MKFIRINKDGSMNELDIKLPKNCLNTLIKNSTSQGNESIKELYSWKHDNSFIKCYGWYDGDAGFENKHDLAPNGSSLFLEEDSSSKILFGDLFIISMNDKKSYNDFTVSDYSLFYDEMNEGFDDCLSEDENDDGYDEEIFSEDEDYNPNFNSEEDNDDYNNTEDYEENEILDTDNNVY